MFIKKLWEGFTTCERENNKRQMKFTRCSRPQNRETNGERREATRKPNAHDDQPRALKFEAKIAWRSTSMWTTTWGGEQ
jgi:hypothetical protein